MKDDTFDNICICILLLIYAIPTICLSVVFTVGIKVLFDDFILTLVSFLIVEYIFASWAVMTTRAIMES